MAYCNTNGFSYAGTQTQQFSCGNSVSRSVMIAMCARQCPGNKTRACGGAQRIPGYRRQAARSKVSVDYVSVICLLLDCLSVPSLSSEGTMGRRLWEDVRCYLRRYMYACGV